MHACIYFKYADMKDQILQISTKFGTMKETLISFSFWYLYCE